MEMPSPKMIHTQDHLHQIPAGFVGQKLKTNAKRFIGKCKEPRNAKTNLKFTNRRTQWGFYFPNSKKLALKP
jgi:hypothetical protein